MVGRDGFARRVRDQIPGHARTRDGLAARRCWRGRATPNNPVARQSGSGAVRDRSPAAFRARPARPRRPSARTSKTLFRARARAAGPIRFGMFAVGRSTLFARKWAIIAWTIGSPRSVAQAASAPAFRQERQSANPKGDNTLSDFAALARIEFLAPPADPPLGPGSGEACRCPFPGRYRRGLEARPPVAFAEGCADRQGSCWLPLDYREHRHDDLSRTHDDADGRSLRRVRTRYDTQAGSPEPRWHDYTISARQPFRGSWLSTERVCPETVLFGDTSGGIGRNGLLRRTTTYRTVHWAIRWNQNGASFGPKPW
jgi:hypothetical protein